MLKDGLTFQDSRMSSYQELIEDLSKFRISITNSHMNCKGGPVLYRDGDIAYLDPGDSHTIFLGPTGSMKSLRFVLPLIYTCGMGEESIVAVDPKGELARKSERFLTEMGYQTVLLNLRNPEKSPDSWNPMDIIQKTYSLGEACK